MGFEETLEKEMLVLGATQCQKVKRGVKAKADEKTIVTLNFALRSALSIQLLVAEFEIKSADDLYHKAIKLPWEEYFSENASFKVDNTVFSRFFNNSGFASLKLKDAIVDRFKSKRGFRPNVNLLKPKVFVHLSIHEHLVSIGFNTSGDALFKRGYRQKSAEAPLNEVLAASLVLKSTWDKKSHLFNPMCGSGTIAIEAALLAKNIAPNIGRKNFGYEHLSMVKASKEDVDSLRRKLISEQTIPDDIQILCTDTDSEMIYATQLNASNAGVLDILKVKKADFFTKKVKFDAPLLFINPPYNERLVLDNPDKFYQDIGSRLKADYGGCKAYIISSYEDVLKNIGLKVKEKTSTTNGALSAYFFSIDLFEGDLKGYKTKNDNY